MKAFQHSLGRRATSERALPWRTTSRHAAAHQRLVICPELNAPNQHIAINQCSTSTRRLQAVICRSTAGNEDGSNFNIDDLARMLSKQAANLRANMSEEEVTNMTKADEQVTFQQLASLGTAEKAAELESLLVEQVGDGGFTSDDFEIVTRLGHISVQQGTGPGAFEAPQTAVIAYVARYVARIAYSMPVPTMIKEYLPVAKAVAYNELLLLQHLCGLPDDKYQAAVSRPGEQGPPVVPLLGYFMSAPSEDACSEGAEKCAEEDSLWLVYKWEGLRPIAMFMEAGPPAVQSSFFKSKEVALQEAWTKRYGMLRAIARKLLAAVDYIHAADVAHGSLSSGSVLLNKDTDCEPDELLVKLDGFGFGQWFSATPLPLTTGKENSSLTGEGGAVGPTLVLDSALEEGKRADLQAVGLLLAETFAAGLAEEAAGRLPRATLRRLLFEVFHEDMHAFREYCLQDANGAFTRLVQFLDERQGAGWEMLGKLRSGEGTALEFSQHPFLQP